MSRFEITPSMLQEAEDLRIEIRPSENKRKLIDVYRDGKYFCSVGANNFLYYNQLVELEGIEFAQRKKEKILARYKNDCKLETLYMLRLLWLC